MDLLGDYSVEVVSSKLIDVEPMPGDADEG